MDEKGLGKRLQKVRRQVGMTQQELCHKAKLSYSTLAKIERGAIKSPSIFTIQSIADALGVTLDGLLGLAPKAQAKQVSKSGIKFVFFDVNGCMVLFSQQCFNRLSAESGVSDKTIDRIYLDYDDKICRAEATPEEFNRVLSQELGMPVNFIDYYLDSVLPMHEIQQTAALVAEKYRFGLLTNIFPGAIDGLLSRGLLPALPYDTVVESSKIGFIKPERQIYEYAEKVCGFSGAEILFVDDVGVNLDAAEAFGWQTLRYDYCNPEDTVEKVKNLLDL